jgi:hypothetical protein
LEDLWLEPEEAGESNPVATRLPPRQATVASLNVHRKEIDPRFLAD